MNAATFLETFLLFQFDLSTLDMTKFFHHLQLRPLLIIVLAFFTIRAYSVGNGGSGYAVLSHMAGNRAPVLNVRANNFSSDFV